MTDDEPVEIPVTEDEARSLDLLVQDFTLMSFMLDGIVVDPKVAMDRSIRCRYAAFTKSDGSEGRITWKQGVVGALSREQVSEFCDPATEQEAYGQIGIEEHISSFQKASEKCKAEEPAKDSSPGARIAARIDCMSRALKEEKRD